jgi:hypothetical protein
LGWVEDTDGDPVAGVVISLFGQGIEGGSLVTLSDKAGRFLLSSLPAGSYMLRALWADRATAVARQVTVLPDEDSVFLLNLEEAAATAWERTDGEQPDSLRELRWLLQHKRRSVLEQKEEDGLDDFVRRAEFGAPASSAPLAPQIAGVIEVVTNPLGWAPGASLADSQEAASTSVLRLQGALTGNVQWSLAGLVAGREAPTWRTLSEFLIEAGGDHTIQAGLGYGSRLLRPSFAAISEDGSWENRSVGALFVRDSLGVGDRLRFSAEGRYTYIGFVQDANHFNPSAAVEFQASDVTQVGASVDVRTIAPGGDMLSVSSLAAAPDMAFAMVEEELEPERVTNARLFVESQVGTTFVGAHAFSEHVHNPLVNVAFGVPSSRTLRITNDTALSTRGAGVTVARQFGSCVNGSVTYTYGRALREASGAPATAAALDFDEASFHDVVGRLETVLSASRTRLVAFYRVNQLTPESDGQEGRAGQLVSTRFDVQLTQGLPFLADMTRADWELLVAYRNLFYEESEGAMLDEMAVIDSPKRIVGGIAVRF